MVKNYMSKNVFRPQKSFGSKMILGQKSFGSQSIWSSKIFGFKKFDSKRNYHLKIGSKISNQNMF